MNEQNYSDFESYSNNEFSVDEKQVFENKLQNDASFKQQFESYKETAAFLETKFSFETIDFKQNLKSIAASNFTENNNQKSKVISLNIKYFAIAACLLLFFGGYYFFNNQAPNYDQFNHHESATFVERGATETNLKAAQKAFNEKKYLIAIPLFETLLKSDNKPEINYFYAICLIETDNYSKAESILTTLKNGKSIYNNRATWYLALMRLKQNKNEECKNYLKQIPADAEDYAKAQELLRLL